VSLAGRRWGAGVAGLLASFPVVAGPALLFFAIEQGTAFAADAAQAVLVSMIGVAASAVAYAWAALRTPWWVSLPVSWIAFVVVVMVLQGRWWTAPLAFVAAVTSFVVARALLPAGGSAAAGTRPRWDLPLRAIAAMIVVLSVTTLARRLGPTLSGAFAPFPVALSILLGFTHAQHGSSTAIRFLRGFLPGMISFAAFCLVLTVALVPLGTAAAFILALACTVPIQAVVLWWMQR
jgi:hypothetical protein